MSKLLLERISAGKMDGHEVWICDFRYGNGYDWDYGKKPTRHVRPQLVLVRGNEETKASIYYSKSHLVSLNKKGEPINSKIIPLYDNTGHRSHGIGVKVFLAEAKCKACYVEQVDVVMRGLAKYKADVCTSIDARLSELEEVKMKYAALIITPAMDSILEYTGSDWDGIIEQFSGREWLDIRAKLSDIFPGEEIDKLAQDIWEELN